MFQYPLEIIFDLPFGFPINTIISLHLYLTVFKYIYFFFFKYIYLTTFIHVPRTDAGESKVAAHGAARAIRGAERVSKVSVRLDVRCKITI